MSSDASTWLIESPVTMVEGEQIAFSIDWLGAATVEEPLVQVYKNGVDITSEVMDAGDEHQISGNVLTMKKVRARGSDGGSRYVLMVEAKVNGNTERRKLLILIAKADQP